MAAELNKEPDVEAKVVRGRLGELSVTIDGDEAVKTNPLWYPTPKQVVKKARVKLRDKD